MNLAICGVLRAGHQHVVRQVTPAAQSFDPGLLGAHLLWEGLAFVVCLLG